ncbi:hypothetical protein ACU686_40515 [Yinghuangia aomiensis]
MTVPRALPHIDAARAALEAAGLTVYLGVAPPDARCPYIAMHPQPLEPSASSLVGEHDQAALVLPLVCVGESVEQVLWLADTVAAALLDRVLTVDGRAGWRPELDATGPPVQRDDDVTPPLHYLTPQYRLTSSAL